MNRADFKPCLMAIAIGSLPHQNGQKALDLVLNYLPEAPCWPQLPNRNFKESMYVQYTEGMPGLIIDEEKRSISFATPEDFYREIEDFYQKYLSQDLNYFAITPAYAQGLYAMLELFKRETPPNLKLIKGQITGPITLGLTLTDEQKRPILYQDTWRDIVIKTLSLKARWQEEKFKEIAPQALTLLFFDEPYLRVYGSAYVSLNREEVINYLNECFREIQGLKGIHVCGNTDWSVLMATEVDVIHFDAYEYLETMTLYPRELKAFLKRGGMLGWGIIPSSVQAERIEEEKVESLMERFDKGIKLFLKEGIEEELLLENSFIAPSCGLGLLPEPLAERALRLTQETSKAMREKYFS